MDHYNFSSLMNNLKAVIPDIFLNSEEEKVIIQSQLQQENILAKVLSRYFKNKTDRFSNFFNALEDDASAIHQLFPSFPLRYIIEQLELFKDLYNRKEIVLRIMLSAQRFQDNKFVTSSPEKRVSEDSYNFNQPLEKIRKMSDLLPSSTITSQSLNTFQDDQNEHFSFSNVPQTSAIGLSTFDNTRPENYVEESRASMLGDLPMSLVINSLPSNLDSADVPRSQPSVIKQNIRVKERNDLFPDPVLSMAIEDQSLNLLKSEEGSEDNKVNEIEAKENSNDIWFGTPFPYDLVPFEEHLTVKSRMLEEAEDGFTSDANLIPRSSTDFSKSTSDTKLFPEVKLESEICHTKRLTEQVKVEKPDIKSENVETKENFAMMAFSEISENFNLLEYLQELTNAPLVNIQRECQHLNLSLNVRPSEEILMRVLTNIISRVSTRIKNEVIDLSHVSEDDSDAELNWSKDHLQCNVKLKTTHVVEIKDEHMDIQLVNRLCSIFPDACPKYIRNLCRGKTMSEVVIDDIINTILDANNQFPKRQACYTEPNTLPENQLEILKEFLPDADPDYLQRKYDECGGKAELIKEFINTAMEKKNYPTLKDYERRQRLSAQQKQYTTEFNVENFVKLIPDPSKFFSDPARKVVIHGDGLHYVLVFLKNKFNRLPVKTIQAELSSVKSLGNIIAQLKRYALVPNYLLKSLRKCVDLPKNIENIPLLQELAYYEHEKEITEYLQLQKLKEERERDEAKVQGLLRVCACCFDEEVLPRDISCCENGCELCRFCIVKSTEILFSEGKLDFPCLNNCFSSFSLQMLQTVLDPKLFSKIAQKKTLEEIKSAGIDELETCPFCDFATIPAAGYSIFTCQNPDCMKESCRMCKEPSHIPYRCDEIEKDEDVKARVYVENQMTEALLRKCWKCGVKFFKEEGCNHMTCSCGAQMCYLCGIPVTSYKHFNGNGGNRFDLCPLYSDSNTVNKLNVLKGAEEAKAAIGNVELKYDPTSDLNTYYQERKKKYPQDQFLVGQVRPPVRLEFQPVGRHVHNVVHIYQRGGQPIFIPPRPPQRRNPR